MAADPDLRVLRNFIAVVTAGSISRAAEQRHIAQPALSQQIRGLEDNLGVRLLERTRQGVVPTAAGERLLVHAHDILRRIDAAMLDVRSSDRSPRGSVTIGLPVSVGKYLTTPLVRRVLERYPDIFLQVAELSTGYFPEMLASGRLDLGATFVDVTDLGLRSTKLVEEELVVLATADMFEAHGIDTDAATLDVRALSVLPMILPPARHSLRTVIDQHMLRFGMPLKVIAEINTIVPLIEQAVQGIGATILSRPSVADVLARPGVRGLRVGDPPWRRGVFLCQPATFAPSLAVDAVREQLLAIVDEVLAAGSQPGLFRCGAAGGRCDR